MPFKETPPKQRVALPFLIQQVEFANDKISAKRVLLGAEFSYTPATSKIRGIHDARLR